ncbi:hypothetical protein N0V90_002746 [Kalmusia sp. IMI 367209]|nr:hypothetical protein N0V90_002746 [Kalmusia sp. IMI 367209]
MLGWNVFLGQRQILPSVSLRSVTDMISHTDMQGLAVIYFAKIDPCYGFVNRDQVNGGIQKRWLPDSRQSTFDAVLCGIAAIGCVFSNLQDLQTEANLFNLAKSFLNLSGPENISVDIATAWVLCTVYLRLTATPDETWIASCTALHIIDAAGLHCEPDANASFRSASHVCAPDTRRRILGVARHLNVWLSFDLGRTRVILQNMSTVSPAPQDGDFTTELLGLLSYTENMDPSKDISGPELVTAVSEVLDRTHTQPPSVLAQCNLMLCLYRRLYTLRWPVADEIMGKAVHLIERGIQAVHTSIEAGSPWHHVANVPFQSICTLLAIDTVQSFSLLRPTLLCLAAVSNTFQTKATKDALTAAHALISMHQKRRETDVLRQSEMLKLYPASEPAGDDMFEHFDLNQAQAFTDLPWFNEFFSDSEITNFINGASY